MSLITQGNQIISTIITNYIKTGGKNIKFSPIDRLLWNLDNISNNDKHKLCKNIKGYLDVYVSRKSDTINYTKLIIWLSYASKYIASDINDGAISVIKNMYSIIVNKKSQTAELQKQYDQFIVLYSGGGALHPSE